LRAWWAELQRSMWPPCVVVRSVGREGPAEVSFSEDQHAVGEFGADGQHERFGETVRPRTPRRDLDDLDARIGEHRVERGRELSGAVADEEPDCATCSPSSITRLRACWVVQSPSGCAVTPRTCRERSVTSSANRTWSRRSVTAQSTWKKSTASMLVAWVRRNCRHVVSVCRSGAGGIRWRLRIRRIVEAPTRWPSVSSSPWILLYP
jgi:hypothetical protein